MRILNLAPHPITLLGRDGTETTIAPETTPARVSATSEQVAEIDGLPVIRQAFGAVEGLPDARTGVMYIVSRVVAARAPAYRRDLLVPARLVRDDAGRIQGCAALESLHEQGPLDGPARPCQCGSGWDVSTCSAADVYCG